MGKWSKIKNRLKALPVDVEYQGKVDAIRHELRGLEIIELGRRYSRARLARQRLDERTYLANIELEALAQTILAWMEDHETSTVKLRTGITLSVKDDIHALVRDRARLFGWIKTARAAYLLTINWQRLNALVKERFEQAPATALSHFKGIGVDVFYKTSLSRRGKNQKEDNGDGK